MRYKCVKKIDKYSVTCYYLNYIELGQFRSCINKGFVGIRFWNMLFWNINL